MKLFKCQNCGQLLYFDNTFCVRCKSRLGYIPDDTNLVAIQPAAQHDQWRPIGPTVGTRETTFRLCANSELVACNWLVPHGSPDTLCRACQLNQLIPDISRPDNLRRWQRLEVAKRQLVYALLKMRLPVVSRTADPKDGLGFKFVADPPAGAAPLAPITTGHLMGVITINIAEADDAEREAQRKLTGEPYRTLLGHFRHEIGHYYWDNLIAGKPPQFRFQNVFGDANGDYGESLKRYYANGPAANWQTNFVSAYASAHPLEDFAETWAHYMHILDTMETAQAFGVSVRPRVVPDPLLGMAADFDPYQEANFSKVIKAWLPLTYAVNGLNRSMGNADLYPFVINPKVEGKLGFIHDLVRGGMR